MFVNTAEDAVSHREPEIALSVKDFYDSRGQCRPWVDLRLRNQVGELFGFRFGAGVSYGR